MRKYVSLHNHTTGSIGDSIISPRELISATKEAGQTAVAITDHGSLSAVWETYKVAKKAGIKLIAGCECYFVDDANDPEDTNFRHLVFLAKNATGYQNLLKLNKRGFDKLAVSFKKAVSRVDWSLLEEFKEGIICTSACGNGLISQYIMNDQPDEAEEAAKRLQTIFGDDFALELQPHNLQRRPSPYSGPVNQQKINIALKNLGEKLGIRCIVATDAHYVKKEDHKRHDAYLCIGSGQPITSGNRLRYDKHEFYIKDSDQVYEHFKRHSKMWGEEFIESLFENTVYYADKCEEPDWIDPAVSTGEKSQLPEFPYKDEPDYLEFERWRADQMSLQTTKVMDDQIADDALFYRYRSLEGLKQKIENGKIPEDDYDECIEQMLEEFDVLEYRNFSSYMLITADFLNWCRKNMIAIGPGRGCLTGDTEVLTNNGFVHLDSIDIGDTVITHKGRRRNVYDKFVYNVDEDGLEIGTNYSFSNIKLTKDHKVFASIATETDRYTSMKSAGLSSCDSVKRWNDPEEPKWIPASDLKIGDYIFMSFPERSDLIRWDGHDYFDLSQFTNCSSIVINEDTIEQKIPKTNDLSIRKISKETGLSRNAIQNVRYNNIHYTCTKEKIAKYFDGIHLSLNDWIADGNTYCKTIDRRIAKNNDLLYVIGRWVGDGWTEHNPDKGYCVGFAFHSDDKDGIDRIFSYFDRKGFDVKLNKSKTKKLVQLTIKGQVLFDFFSGICEDYKQTSCTKHLPSIFRDLSKDNLQSLLLGLLDSDGHVEIAADYKRENIDTTSKRLALEVKEALLYLGIPSSIITRPEYYSGKYKCKQSYKIRFKGIKLPKTTNSLVTNLGYFCKITSIAEVHLDTVYDISVNEDTSYLTSNYAVHNSVGGSLTAYINGIHQAYPKRYGLIFARFLNKYKEAFPDIDNDIAPSGRGKLHDYLCSKYGAANVAHVSNINTITPKVYARDIARVFEFGGQGRSVAAEIGNNIADSLPDDVKSIKKALTEAPLFAEYAKQYPELEEYAELCGLPRAWSTHAGGIVVSKRPLEGLVPLRRDTNGALVLEYDKEIAEENGLVKIDTLGLETLDIIGETYNLIREVGKELPKEPFDYEIVDDSTYELIGDGDTFGVFQLGSTAVPVCKKVKPRSVEDIALVSALVRPSSKDSIPDVIEVRNGIKDVSLPNKALERAFGNTYGIGLFEESLLFLAGDFAGWDLHDADKLRKLTKEKGKNPEKAAKWKEEFIEGAISNKGFTREFAEQVWDTYVESFSGYGFNRSHATLYSMISFHTAYLKANYPLEFLVANLMSEVRSNAKSAKDNILKIKTEIRSKKVKIVPPDLNNSSLSWKIVNDHTLMTGLDSLKYMGKDSIPELIEKRPFVSFQDLIHRTDSRKVRSPSIQAMAASGSLDSFDMDRKLMFHYASDYRAKLRNHVQRFERQMIKEWAAANGYLKGEDENGVYWFDANGRYEPPPLDPDDDKVKYHISQFNYPFPKEEPWSIQETFALEDFYMGEGISGTTFDRYPKFFDRKKTVPFAALKQMFPWKHQSEDDRANRKMNTHFLGNHRIRPIEAVVTSIFSFIVKKEDSPIFGQEMARLSIQDPWGDEAAMLCFPEAWEGMKNRIEKELSGGKQSIEPGIAIRFLGSFQWENEHSTSFVLSDILDYKAPPSLPEDRSSKKVKMPRAKKLQLDLFDTSKEELLLELEDEALDNGLLSIEDSDLEEYK